ncbi:MAG: secretin N-terminal domain-containing protein [Verrucomicrobiota bacterium]
MRSIIKAAFLTVLGLAMGIASNRRAMAEPTNSVTLPERAVSKARATQRLPEATAVFMFPGGTPGAFLNAVQTFCQVDWSDIVTIPNEMAQAQVPKLRVPTAQAQDLLQLYNRLGAKNPTLGQWYWEGPVEQPFFLALAPAQAGAAPDPGEEPVALRVFQLRYISGTNLSHLADAITTAADLPNESARKNGLNPRPGRLVIDQRTGSLIAAGSASYLTRVESVVRALDIPALEPAQVLSGPGRSAGEKR